MSSQKSALSHRLSGSFARPETTFEPPYAAPLRLWFTGDVDYFNTPDVTWNGTALGAGVLSGAGLGLLVVRPHELPLAEQAWLFSRAHLLIGVQIMDHAMSGLEKATLRDPLVRAFLDEWV